MHSCFLPGILIVCVVPCCSRRTGGTAVVGEELILPLSALGERFPLTRISQPPSPWTNEIQLPPWYLHLMQEDEVRNKIHGQHSLILCRKETTGALQTTHSIMLCINERMPGCMNTLIPYLHLIITSYIGSLFASTIHGVW